MRWLLLDEVITIEKGTRAVTKSHTPKVNGGPETLLIEMMAQTGALLIGAENNFEEDLIFAKIENATFYRSFIPGESLEIEASSENLRSEGAWIDGKIWSRHELVASGRLLLMNIKRLDPKSSEPISFHQAFMQYFQIREKVSRLSNPSSVRSGAPLKGSIL